MDNPKLTFWGTQVRPHKFELDRKYVGVNGLGTRVTVSEYFYTNFYLAIANIDQFEGYETSLLSPEIMIRQKMSVEDAKRIKLNLAALYIINLVHPYFGISGDELKKATIADPSETHLLNDFLMGDVKEIWFFDKSNGIIFLKIKPKPKVVPSD